MLSCDSFFDRMSCYFTVTLQVTFFLPAWIVIVAFPFFFAFILPFALTVTILVLEDL